MSIREASLLMYRPQAAPPRSDDPREDQVQVLAAYAYDQLNAATTDGRPHRAAVAARVLLDCHELLNKIDIRRVREGPTEKQKEHIKQLHYDELAVIALIQENDDLKDLFFKTRARIVREHEPPPPPPQEPY